jgi:hypothetical protein
MNINRQSISLMGMILLVGVTLVLTLAYRLTDSVISDSIGYVQASHQLARGEGLAFVDPHNQLDRRYYMLYAFKVIHPDDSNRYFGLLPGIPLFAAAVERLTGDPSAVHVLVPILAALLIAVMYPLGLLLGNAWIGLWAGLALFVTSTFLQFSTAFYSEIPSATFLYLGCVFVLLSFRCVRDDGYSIGLACIGGLSIGMTFFMRFSNMSVIPGILILVWLVTDHVVLKERRTISLLSILGISLLALFIFNTTYYGGPFTTGYSPLHGWYAEPAFSLAYAFGKSFVNGYSVPAIIREQLNDLGVLLLFAVAGLTVRPRRTGIWLLNISFWLLAPYAVYAFAAEGANARFVIPALPAICLLVGRGIVAVGRWLPRPAWRWIIGGGLTAGMCFNLPASLSALNARNQAAEATIANVQSLLAPMEPNAVVLSYVFNDLIAVYGHRSVLTYRHMTPYDPVARRYQNSQFEGLLDNEIDQLISQGTPVYYILDGNPPLLNSYEVLKRHFELTSVLSGEPIYRIRRLAN